jgi:microcompartment protein CcmL/EutN
MALGLIECPFLSVTAMVSDSAAKAANVRLLGIETTGNERLLVKLQGDVGAVEAAVSAGAALAQRMGVEVVTEVIAQPAEEMQPLVTFQNAQNPLYGGRDQLLPTDYPETAKQNMNEKHLALGILETQGLTAILEATDAMLKAANVTLVGKEKIGAAYVTVIVKGDVAAVTAAVEAGQRAVGNLGKLVAAHVIARPHEELAALLPK